VFVIREILRMLLSPVPVVDAESSSRIAKFHRSFWTSEFAGSALKAPFRIMCDLLFFKSESFCRAESQTWLVSAIFAQACNNFNVLLFVYLKAYEAKAFLNTDVYRALTPLTKSRRI
jgi:hypothetical protein